MTIPNRLLLLLAALTLPIAACSDSLTEPHDPASDAQATDRTPLSAAADLQVAEDRFVVVLEDGVGPAAAERIAAAFNGEVLHVYMDPVFPWDDPRFLATTGRSKDVV